MSIWDELQYFKEDENWGDPEKMNGYLLLMLDKLRDLVGSPFVVHCGYENSGHATKSKHYTGDAVDFHIDTKIDFESQVKMMEYYLKDLQLENFVGMGIYPFWARKGFHIDCRGTKARWGCLRDGTYVSMEMALEQLKNGK
jgi:uncharacterized protein YcbK (DUF882 family)